MSGNSSSGTYRCDQCAESFDTAKGLRIHEATHPNVSGCQMPINDGFCSRGADRTLTFEQPDRLIERDYCDEHAELASRSDCSLQTDTERSEADQ